MKQLKFKEIVVMLVGALMIVSPGLQAYALTTKLTNEGMAVHPININIGSEPPPALSVNEFNIREDFARTDEEIKQFQPKEALAETSQERYFPAQEDQSLGGSSLKSGPIGQLKQFVGKLSDAIGLTEERKASTNEMAASIGRLLDGSARHKKSEIAPTMSMMTPDGASRMDSGKISPETRLIPPAREESVGKLKNSGPRAAALINLVNRGLDLRFSGNNFQAGEITLGSIFETLGTTLIVVGSVAVVAFLTRANLSFVSSTFVVAMTFSAASFITWLTRDRKYSSKYASGARIYLDLAVFTFFVDAIGWATIGLSRLLGY